MLSVGPSCEGPLDANGGLADDDNRPGGDGRIVSALILCMFSGKEAILVRPQGGSGKLLKDSMLFIDDARAPLENTDRERRAFAASD